MTTYYYKTDFGPANTTDWNRYVLLQHDSADPPSRDELICLAGNKISEVLSAEGADPLLYRYGEPQQIHVLLWKVAPDVRVGDILLLGRLGGAVCNHYRVIGQNASEGTALVRVKALSRKNDDNTFSTVWALALGDLA